MEKRRGGAGGATAGREGRRNFSLFPNTSHKLRRITGEINQALWIIYIYLYLKRTKRERERAAHRQESYCANVLTASEQVVPVGTH